MPEHVNALAIGFELMLVVVGLWVLWTVVLSPSARAQQQPRALAAWDAPLIDFLLFLWCAVCGGMLFSFGSSLLLKSLSLGANERLILGNAAFALGELAGLAFYFRGLSRRDSRPPPAPAAKANIFIAGGVTFLISIPVVFVVGLATRVLLEVCGLPADEQDLIGIFANAKSRAFLAVLIVVASLIAPIAEEMVFRAGLFRYARTRLPRWAALVAPACLFAALHQNLASFPQLVALAVILSLAYERTGRIGTPIVAHALFNLHTIVLILLGADS